MVTIIVALIVDTPEPEISIKTNGNIIVIRAAYLLSLPESPEHLFYPKAI